MQRDTVIRVVLGVISGFGMALAAFLLIAPDVGPPPLLPFQDKLFHAVAFACLTGPAVLVLPRQYLWFWVAHMVALGGGIEVAQAMGDEGRSGDVADFVADCVGIVAALGVGRWIRGRFEAGAVTGR
ncbi:MAG: hypothetical protein EON61_01430 [Alphaproteobacteria bacterium]|nr:MAG: hypothetical protein EON61_01430 [Alphaproteobacteria bacterium]